MKKLCLLIAAMLCCIMLNAQQPTGDGSQATPYLLTNYADLQWFAEQVNDGQNGICAKLTDNIAANQNVLNADGSLNGTPSNTWTPIGGQNGKDYSGEFNGDGHTISGLFFNSDSRNNVGLFGKAVGNAHIHDLGVSDSYFYGKDHVGAICGDFASGLIENCWNGATIYAKDWNAGGISGSCYVNASIRDCYNIGKIMPCNGGNPSYGGICGAVYENTGVGYTISNCHTLEGKCDKGVYGSLDGGCPASEINNSFVKDATAFASGEVCWLLNNGVTDGTQKWYQTLGGSTDNFPVLDNSHGTVYYGYDGNVLKYSNSPLTPLNSAAYIDVNGEPQTADNVTEITNSSSTLNAGWYVVRGSDVETGTLTCNGDVHLILADGAKLTAQGGKNQAGITVSGNHNTLDIYGQTAQSGRLIANGGDEAAGIGGGREQSGSRITINGGEITANGGYEAAGIGGGREQSGSEITINGGEITATGGSWAAGIGGGYNGNGSSIWINDGTVTATGGYEAAGIGGGDNGNGSYIWINDGTVTATGGDRAAGIGSGYNCLSPSSSICVAASLTVYADNTNPPTTEIPHTNYDDIASHTACQYVIVKDVATGAKEAAIAAINAAIDGVTNADIIAIATNAINAINAATTVYGITVIKDQALATIDSAKAVYNSALGGMGTPCEDCPVVEVKKGDKTIILYNPESVTFKKTE